MKTNLTDVTKAYIAAREAAEAATQAAKQAEVAMKEAYAREGISANVVDGIKVSVNRKARRTVDAGLLATMVSKALFKVVTKPQVDLKKFDAAVTTGQIKPEVIDAVTGVTEYDEVRVTVLVSDDVVSAAAAAA